MGDAVGSTGTEGELVETVAIAAMVKASSK